METQKPDIKFKFSIKPKLPTLPIGIQELLKLLANNNVTYPQLASVIKNHPNIVARLIALANSAWAASVVPINNLETACARLGMTVVRSTSIALAIASPFNPARCPGFNVQRFWTTAMLVAEASGLLALQANAKIFQEQGKEAAETAGILHHFGLLWFADQMPEETGKVFNFVKQNPSVSIGKVLRERTYSDYATIGGWIAREWGLPELLAVSIEHHLESQYQQDFWELVLVVGGASRMAAAILRGDEQPPANYRLESLGIHGAIQEEVYLQLGKKHERCLEMAKVFFS